MQPRLRSAAPERAPCGRSAPPGESRELHKLPKAFQGPQQTAQAWPRLEAAMLLAACRADQQRKPKRASESFRIHTSQHIPRLDALVHIDPTFEHRTRKRTPPCKAAPQLPNQKRVSGSASRFISRDLSALWPLLGLCQLGALGGPESLAVNGSPMEDWKMCLRPGLG